MKRLTALWICSIMALAITACGIQSPGTQEQKAEPDGKIEEAVKRNGLKGIKETKKLVVCTSPDYAPFEFEDPSREGQSMYVGADMELARYLAEKLEVELEIQAMGFEECLEAVSEKRADVGLMGLLAKEERSAEVEYTAPYYDEGDQVILVLKERLEEFPDMDSFAGKTVAAQNGTLQAQLVMEQLPESYMDVITTVSDGLPMLRSKMADGIAVRSADAEKLIKENDDLAAAPEGFVYTSDGIVGCIAEDEPELKKALNDIFAEVADSDLYYGWIDEANQLAAYLSRK